MKALLRKLNKPRVLPWLWLGGSTLLLGFFVELSSELSETSSDSIQSIDTFIVEQAVAFRMPWLDGVAMDFTALGSTAVLTFFCLLFFVLMMLLGKKQQAAQLAIIASSAAILTQVLKGWFERSRPEESLRLVRAIGYSYPSGHSLSSAAIYLTLAILACVLFKTHLQRLTVLLFTAFLIGVIGLSRIYLGVHYPSDVAAGILLGVAWACFWQCLFLVFPLKR